MISFSNLASLQMRKRSLSNVSPIRLAWSTSTFVVLLALLGAVTGAARGSPRFVWAAALLLALSTVFVNADALRFQVPFGAFEALLGGAALAWFLLRVSSPPRQN